jgi:hypothetical protein
VWLCTIQLVPIIGSGIATAGISNEPSDCIKGEICRDKLNVNLHVKRHFLNMES